MHCLAPRHHTKRLSGHSLMSSLRSLLYFIGISLFCMRREAIGTALQLPASFSNQPVYKYQLMEGRKSEENNQM